MKNSIIVPMSMVLLGCSSIESVPYAKSDSVEGLAYYMPKKDILIKLVKLDGKVTSVTLETTGAYPDLSKAYNLRFKKSLAGKNVANIGVDTNGLLASTKSTMTSGVSEAFRNLGEAIGTAVGLAAPAATAIDNCIDGTHSFTMPAPASASQATVCGLRVNIKKITDVSIPAAKNIPIKDQSNTPRPGIFYKQAEPYRVNIAGAYNTSTILFSPSESTVNFLPISGTFFSNNEADFGFTDGMPTKYNQSADGEVIGLLKLPADVLAAYFGAVGKIFDSFKAKDNKESEVLVASTKLDLAKLKYQACIDAIQSKNNTTIEQLNCGE
ncbi:hypothetical protein [Pseudomonas thivervalensis]|uniref:hypothetical protein n=1 Tax=Pseudomonas thivervalensis TaxID=86265 RepID=UPI003D6BE1DA